MDPVLVALWWDWVPYVAIAAMFGVMVGIVLGRHFEELDQQRRVKRKNEHLSMIKEAVREAMKESVT